MHRCVSVYRHQVICASELAAYILRRLGTTSPRRAVLRLSEAGIYQRFTNRLGQCVQRSRL